VRVGTCDCCATDRMAQAFGKTHFTSLLISSSPAPKAHTAFSCLAVPEAYVYDNGDPNLYSHARIEALRMAQEAEGAHLARRRHSHILSSSHGLLTSGAHTSMRLYVGCR
jgi:hypothetical protein